MAGRYTKEYSESLVNGYIKQIEEQKKNIRNNFKDMDFENNEVRNDFERVVNRLIENCDRLIYEIRSKAHFE